MNTQFSCPVGYAHGFAVGSDVVSDSLVARLLGRRGPLAVGWRVIAVYVNSFKGKPIRHFPHVGKKVGEVIPPFADRDSSGAIVGELWVSRSEAPSAHIPPGVVLSGSCHPVLFSAATATAALAIFEGSGCNQLGLPAIAKTVPSCSSACVIGSAGKHQQFLKSLTGEVVRFFGHFITSIMANNHWRERSNRVIEVPLSAAKPSYAGGF